MKKKELFEKYKKHYKEWEWFFVKYNYHNEFMVLEVAIQNEEIEPLADIMGKVWFELPDNIFNIMNMPDGWKSFLRCIENLSEVEREDVKYEQN